MINTTTSIADRSAKYITGQLLAHLGKGERVLWLVPGGSGLGVAAAVTKLLKGPYERLFVSLTDERYGQPDHPDSNWRQLLEAGFNLPGAHLQPVLDGSSLAQTARRYARQLADNLTAADYSLALAGMGADGHVLGIKPDSPAIESEELAIGYEWSDFTRLTATPAAIAKLDEVVLYAVGAEKYPQLADLERSLPISKQPAQALKQAGKLTIFSDYKGGEA